MRHRRKQAKLGVTASHRRALLAHIVEGLVEHQRVRTTIDRAKEARRLAEHLISLAKRNTLNARREILSTLYSENAARRMFEIIGPTFSDVKGGYTRIIREAPRPGDGAQRAFLEFSKPIELIEPKPRKKKARKIEKPAPEKKVKEKKKKWEEVPLVKKETLEKEEKVKKREKPAAEEEKKKGGFLTKLRKFLTGEK